LRKNRRRRNRDLSSERRTSGGKGDGGAKCPLLEIQWTRGGGRNPGNGEGRRSRKGGLKSSVAKNLPGGLCPMTGGRVILRSAESCRGTPAERRGGIPERGTRKLDVNPPGLSSSVIVSEKGASTAGGGWTGKKRSKKA